MKSIKTKDIISSKYKIVELLFEDLTSYCYKGITHYSDIPVFIFEYKSKYLNHDLIRRCIQLAEKLLAFKHPNLLNLLDYYYDGKNFFVICEGVTDVLFLEDYLKSKKQTKLDSLWSYCTKILDLFVCLEKENIICGTLNLSNILILPGNQLKLLRSTISHEILKESWEQFTVVEDCIFYGPEFLEHKIYKSFSDIYSFGILLYLLFSQTWPYKYELKVSKMKKQILKGPLPFTPISDKVPTKLVTMIETCIKPDPQHRFSSFNSLIAFYKGDEDVFFKLKEHESDATIQNDLKVSLAKNKLKHTMVYLKLFAMMIFIFFLGVFSYNMYVNYITAIPEIAVPVVVGMDYKEAESFLEKSNLRSFVAGSRVHPLYPKGIVVESKPPQGRIVKEDRLIRLFISKGKGPVLVPDFVGYIKDEVDEIVSASGISVGEVIEKYSLEYPKGVVIDQDPNPNVFLPVSENILLTISKGFPIVVDTYPIKRSFFNKKNNLLKVVTELFVLKGWVGQEVKITYVLNDIQEVIYEDFLNPGERKQLEFELEKNGKIQVFFNDGLIYSSLVEQKGGTQVGR